MSCKRQALAVGSTLSLTWSTYNGGAWSPRDYKIWNQGRHRALNTWVTAEMLGACSVVMFLAIAVTATLSLPESSSTFPPKSHSRVKRCSCNNWMDKECIYFCHLDIIWVNTGSQMLPYGLGSPGRRKKRSSIRCQCKDVKDPTCISFCLSTAWATGESKPGSSQEIFPVNNFQNNKMTQVRLLRVIRDIAGYNTHAAYARKHFSVMASKLPSDSKLWVKRR